VDFATNNTASSLSAHSQNADEKSRTGVNERSPVTCPSGSRRRPRVEKRRAGTLLALVAHLFEVAVPRDGRLEVAAGAAHDELPHSRTVCRLERLQRRTRAEPLRRGDGTSALDERLRRPVVFEDSRVGEQRELLVVEFDPGGPAFVRGYLRHRLVCRPCRDPLGEVVEDLWDALEGALDWIDDATDAVGDDPFLSYRSSGEADLHHKAWRDSALSMQFADGTLASPPLASVEVQGYLYDALRRTAKLLREVADEDERDDSAR
jgi:hypothetical protein